MFKQIEIEEKKNIFGASWSSSYWGPSDKSSLKLSNFFIKATRYVSSSTSNYRVDPLYLIYFFFFFPFCFSFLPHSMFTSLLQKEFGMGGGGSARKNMPAMWIWCQLVRDGKKQVKNPEKFKRRLGVAVVCNGDHPEHAQMWPVTLVLQRLWYGCLQKSCNHVGLGIHEFPCLGLSTDTSSPSRRLFLSSLHILLFSRRRFPYGLICLFVIQIVLPLRT